MMIILEAGVAAGWTPGAGSSVRERVYVRCLCMYALEPGSRGRSGHIITA